jgi:hypothetical protein
MSWFPWKWSSLDFIRTAKTADRQAQRSKRKFLHVERLETRVTPSTVPPAALGQFVSSLYQDLLGRAASPAEVSAWSALAASVPPGQIVADILETPEYHNAFVSTAYEQLLGRLPDALGAVTWSSAMSAGKVEEQVKASFVSSLEFFLKNGASPVGYVEALYTNVLRRVPDPAGVGYWLGRLAFGTSPLQMATEFVVGTEYATAEITRAYETYLRREPDASGLTAWVHVYQGGGNIGQVRTGILSSQEYIDGLASTRFLNQTALNYAPPQEVSDISRLGRYDPASQFYVPITAQSLPADMHIYVFAHGWAPGYLSEVQQNSSPGHPLLWWQTEVNLPGSPGGPLNPYWFSPTNAPANGTIPAMTVDPVGFAKAILKLDPKAVVVAYSWIDESATSFLQARLSEAHTTQNGLRLANALQQALPANFNQAGGELHLIGHSHGSKVATVAAYALQQSSQPVAQLTILDSPENSVADQGNATNFDWYYLQKMNLGRTPLTGSQGTFVDNYVSEFGTRLGVFPETSPVVDVTLNPLLYSALDLVDTHAYAAAWYSGAGQATAGTPSPEGLAASPLLNPSVAPGLPAALTQSWTAQNASGATQFQLATTQASPGAPTVIPLLTPLAIAPQSSSPGVQFASGDVTLIANGSSAFFNSRIDPALGFKGADFQFQFFNATPGTQLVITIDNQLFFVMSASAAQNRVEPAIMSLAGLLPDPIHGHSMTIGLVVPQGGQASVSVAQFHQVTY